MDISTGKIIGQLVAEDYRTASVFKSYGIDFCCNGNRTIGEACTSKNIEPNALIEALSQATKETSTSTEDFRSWDMDLLADYIEKKHHRYVEKKIPELQAYLSKLVKVHGDRHPELIQIEQLFMESAHGLAAHMKKEELILFPYVRKMQGQSSVHKPHFGTVQNPIQMMMHEHDTEGRRFREMATLTNNYNPPPDACTTYRVAFAMLKEFEEDLHRHIHLENNILFPKAIEAESALSPV